MSGDVLVSGKLAVFVDPLKNFTSAQLAAYAALGYELGVVPAGQGGVGMMYVDRGDAADFDKGIADFTKDGADHDLDLSAIVPAGAKAIHLRVQLDDSAALSTISFRKKGNVNPYNTLPCAVLIAGKTKEWQGIVSCSAARVLTYQASVSGTWTTISLAVLGWLI